MASGSAIRCRSKFLRFFPKGFRDKTYLDWEREYNGTRVLTWPLVTVFGFIAQPDAHIFLKPNVTRIAAKEYGFDFQYQSRPSWATYASLLELAALVRRDQKELKPCDMIDIQSFMWVQGSDECEE